MSGVRLTGRQVGHQAGLVCNVSCIQHYQKVLSHSHQLNKDPIPIFTVIIIRAAQLDRMLLIAVWQRALRQASMQLHKPALLLLQLHKHVRL